MMNIIPIIIEIIAFILGPPGAFIKRVKPGEKMAPRPNRATVNPIIKKIVLRR